MTVLAVGLSHRTAPIQLLERVAVSGDRSEKLLLELLECDSLSEVVLLSTCNRVEVYAVADSFHSGFDDVAGVLARHAGVEVPDLGGGLYVHYARAAVEHLFTVAAGMDSMVVGESQILGQLRSAYAMAERLGTVGSVLHDLSQQALRVGKRVHAETGIGSEGASVVSEALSDASELLGGLAGRRALLVGAGSMGGLAAAHLRRAGAVEIVVANRGMDNARRLAELSIRNGTPARAVGLDSLAEELAGADVVVACTGAVDAVVEVGAVVRASQLRAEAGRAHHPLVLCDLGLPKDVAPGVADLPQVRVVDLESLRARLRDDQEGSAFARASEVLAEEVANYLAAQRSAQVTPTVTALRKRAADVVDAELLRLDSRLPDLDVTVREELARTVRRVVDKLLHTPTVRVKELAAGPGGGDYADALRELFALDPRMPGAVTSARGGAGSALPAHGGPSRQDAPPERDQEGEAR
ncbi:glutamyl-tRNA reductase [Actinoalloteichus spitiensis]|uniref:glutamyl-tRNA reductase n=1 Tax=Actinoalloteichus spitiensis TaxID=252394 RepID=UPI000372ABBB|nr:glutamyl-tRNA reductase [Actinoalloteichus spitiensis]